ncbi:MAG TPA: HNH endonuclease signature motif containing protein [Actinomycetota bacterium]|nr:HNH endonuclease signature motif containing protein [Actinomycetota bacterium]
MFDIVDTLLRKLKACLADFDFTSVEKDAAIGLYDKLVELERVVSAAKNLAADWVAESGAWWSTPYRSPAHFMAATEAKPVNGTALMLHSVGSMRELPPVEAAYRQGALNDEQAQEVVSAALAAPDQQEYLLQVAEGEALIEFRRECARVRSAALSEDQRQKNAHTRRFMHNWIDADGAFRLSGRFTTEAGAEILSALEPIRQKIADRNSRRGRRGKVSHGAAMADSLVDLCRAHNAAPADPLRPAPRASIQVRVDLGALERGHAVPGEVCEVLGVGPVTVDTVRRWMALPQSRLDAILMDERGVRDVVRSGRAAIPTKLLVALQERDRTCVVPGCGEIHDLEIDHVVPVHRGGPTTLHNLCRLCAWHHYLKTHHGYLLKRRLGHWLWESSGGGPPRRDTPEQELAPV